VNSFHVTLRVPPEIFGVISSYLTEEDVFSASQVCHHWRSILISTPSLWTRISCRRVPRTIVSLGRCKSLPIRLRIESPLPTAALENILLLGNKVASLTVTREPDQIPLLDQLLIFSRPSVEQLHIYSERMIGWRAGEEAVHNVWQDLPSLRELSVCRYSIPIEQLAAPSLVHLALENTGANRNVMVRSVLDMLHGCPLLETLLIIYSSVWGGTTHDHSPVRLQSLRSLELGPYEVHSELTTYLQFPPGIAVGLREMPLPDIHGDTPPGVMATIQHVLGRIGLRCITLAVPPRSKPGSELLIRFDGLEGSLEMAARGVFPGGVQNILSSPRGVLFSSSPPIEDVRELHIIGCSFGDGQMFHHIYAAMPNLTSISFFHCKGRNLLGLLCSTRYSSPPFPHLERIMILGSTSGLKDIARRRRDYNVPLRTLVIGRGPMEFGHNHLDGDAELGGLVNGLHIGCPTEVLEWETRNEILNIWSATGVPGSVSPNEYLEILG